MDINALLDQAKTRANLPSDYALAKALGIPQSNTTNWRKGKRHPSNEEAVQLATLAGLNEMQVIAEIEMASATTEKKKKFWRHYLESRGITACVALTGLALMIAFTPEQAQAGVLQLGNYDGVFCAAQESKIYIMRTSEPAKAVRFAVWLRVLQNPCSRKRPVFSLAD
jgi:hypothetical protein